MTTGEQNAFTAFKSNLGDVESMLNHLEDHVDNFASEDESEFTPDKAEVVRGIREGLIVAIKAVGLTREEIEDTLEEQRHVDGAICEAVPEVVAAPEA